MNPFEASSRDPNEKVVDLQLYKLEKFWRSDEFVGELGKVFKTIHMWASSYGPHPDPDTVMQLKYRIFRKCRGATSIKELQRFAYEGNIEIARLFGKDWQTVNPDSQEHQGDGASGI